jgi:hypothetical protein
MAIPESQLEAWSRQGPVMQSSGTYMAVRTALMSSRADYAAQSFDVFLQGSYANDTNIHGETDVDTVIRLNTIFGCDLSNLTPRQQTALRRALVSKSDYTFMDFKRGVLSQLSTAFGKDCVSVGNKTIKIKAGVSRKNADVVVCHQYRRYVRFVDSYNYRFAPGLFFCAASGERLIGYPEVHLQNCTIKHEATGGLFKPFVRIVKNMRNRLSAESFISIDTASSYFIESLLYNIPDDLFGTSYVDTFCNCMNWLLCTDITKFACAHEHILSWAMEMYNGLATNVIVFLIC